MPIDRIKLAASAATALLLAGCAMDNNGLASTSDTFGEATRQTLAAQIIDPDPHYDTAVPVSSGQHAAKAIERYNTDAVKKPDKTTTTTKSGAGGGG